MSGWTIKLFLLGSRGSRSSSDLRLQGLISAAVGKLARPPAFASSSIRSSVFARRPLARISRAVHTTGAAKSGLLLLGSVVPNENARVNIIILVYGHRRGASTSSADMCHRAYGSRSSKRCESFWKDSNEREQKWQQQIRFTKERHTGRCGRSTKTRGARRADDFERRARGDDVSAKNRFLCNCFFEA